MASTATRTTSQAATLDRPLNYEEVLKFPKVKPLPDPVHKMQALEWHGNKDVRVVTRPRPMITDPDDAIIHITSTTVCGSDLHLYHNEFAGLEKGDVLGHECMGIVEAVGDNVKNLKVGTRVVVSAVIADGKCYFCKRKQFSLCDTTNPDKGLEATYGCRLSGIFGYSHLLGGFDGGQAEYIRVPYAEVNTLPVPSSLSDEKVLFLSDIACTGWHANELSEVSQGDTVAIWGCGPVGLMAAAWAKFRGAERVISIDKIPYRLQVAQKCLGVEVINASESDVLKTLHALIPGGPDVCIEAAGFRYAQGVLHSAQRTLRLETDTPEILTQAILACRKGGRMAVVGDYYNLANNFPIGALMEKSITFRGGQVFVQKYWKELLGYIESGRFDPTFVITHTLPFEEMARAYKIFDEKEDNSLKIFLKTNYSASTSGGK